MKNPIEIQKLKEQISIVFAAPFYDRSGYGNGARAYARLLWEAGLRVRIHPVGEGESGIDDCDLELLSRLEKTELKGTVVLLVYHVATPVWLGVSLPPNSIRAIATTHEVAWQNIPPAKEFVEVCNAMDLVLLAPEEIPQWLSAGLDGPIVQQVRIPHPWITEMSRPELSTRSIAVPRKKFRFLTIAMFMPRRRWDSLFRSFLKEFENEGEVELYVKTNYPAWHPTPGQPERDLKRLIEKCIQSVPSKATIVIDDNIGTRRELVDIIDSSDAYVSTDIMPTAGVGESLMRGKPVVVPRSFAVLPCDFLPREMSIFIEERDVVSVEIDSEFLKYSPYHSTQTLPILSESEIRLALRQARSRVVPENFAEAHGKWFSELKEKYSADDLLVGLQRVMAARRNIISVHWEGSFAPFGSLAKVNRQITERLDQKTLRLTTQAATGEVLSVPQCDITPKITKYRPNVDVIVRHQWPPDFSVPEGGRLVFIQPWEYGSLPQSWVSNFNRIADEVWVPSTWVRDCYVDSGVDSRRVFVIPNGVDPRVYRPDGVQYPLKTGKKFKFLYVGAAIHRKGIDLLVKAFDYMFSSTDDVCLVIKAGQYKSYSDQPFIEQIRNRSTGQPEIELIEDDLSDYEVASLFRACDVTVIPFRGEGFCLPLLESLACAVPVIATDGGGASDFLRPNFAYLVRADESDVVWSEDAREFLGAPSPGGYWQLAPKLEDLCIALRAAVANPEQLRRRGAEGREYVVGNFGWEIAASAVTHRLALLSEHVPWRLRTHRTTVIARASAEEQVIELVMSFASAFDDKAEVSLLLLTDGNRDVEKAFDEAKTAVVDSIDASLAGRIEMSKSSGVSEGGLLPNTVAVFDELQGCFLHAPNMILKSLNQCRRLYRQRMLVEKNGAEATIG